MGDNMAQRNMEARCYLCGKTDEEMALLHVKLKGEGKWVCAKCLPRLIHG